MVKLWFLAVTMFSGPFTTGLGWNNTLPELASPVLVVLVA